MAGRVRLAKDVDVDAVAAVLATAYAADPWIAWIVAAERRQERVTALQSSLIAVVGLPHGKVWLGEDGDRNVGAALWLPAAARFGRSVG